MTRKKTLLSIHELKAGMISANNVVLNNDMLVGEGVVITETAIFKLKQNFLIDKVEVYLDYAAEKTLCFNIKSNESLQNSLNEFSANLEEIFESMSNVRVAEIEEVRNFTKRIRDEFTATSMVIRNIVFHGNGNDSIYRHSVNVAAVSYILGKWLGFAEKELNFLTYSALLHDIGKMSMDMTLVNKHESLTMEEKKIYINHPVIGYNAVKSIPYLDSSVSYGVLMHHERMDGSGYPFGIKKDKIHKFAKIIAIADQFDDLCSNRQHKNIKSPLDAFAIIQQESVGKLDSFYCSMLINHVINFYIGENVILNNSQAYKIVRIDLGEIARPIVMNEDGLLDLSKQPHLYIEKIVMK
jgi:uncharacterized domain HDIG